MGQPKDFIIILFIGELPILTSSFNGIGTVMIGFTVRFCDIDLADALMQVLHYLGVEFIRQGRQNQIEWNLVIGREQSRHPFAPRRLWRAGGAVGRDCLAPFLCRPNSKPAAGHYIALVLQEISSITKPSIMSHACRPMNH